VERLKTIIAVATVAAASLLTAEASAATRTVCSAGCNFNRIQNAINASTNGDIIDIRAGTYTENITVTKTLTLQGPSSGTTATVRPAISAPTPPTCTAAQSLCTGASSIILVQADNVTIKRLTLDGNNPTISSGVTSTNIDVDARNGIITNNLVGVFTGLQVSNVTVQNIYLRGIETSSTAQSALTFSFSANQVINVHGNANAIGIFNFGGSGTIDSNVVSGASGGIVANHSRSTFITNNTVINAGSSIHSDNSGDLSGSTADTIDSNTVQICDPNGFGVYVFAPTVAPTVTNNDVSDCTVGIGLFARGSTTTGTTSFSNNVVDGGTAPANSVGIFASTDKLGFGADDAFASFTSNRVEHFETGLLADESKGGQVHLDAANNVIAGNTKGADGTAALGVAAKNNFWGCNAGPGQAGCNPIATTSFSTNPWLVSRVGVSPFPPTAGQTATVTVDLTTNSAGLQSGGGTIPDGTPVDFDSSPTGLVFTPDPGVSASGTASATFTANGTSQPCARVPANVPTAELVCATAPTSNDACPATPYPLAVGSRVQFTGTTVGATDDFTSFCGDTTTTADTPDLVYAFTLPTEGTLKIDVTSQTTGYRPAVYVRTDCAADLFCFDAGANGQVVAGDFQAGTYFVVVDGVFTSSGQFQLTATFNAPVCGDGVVNSGEQCDVGAGAPNDGCGDPGTTTECQFENPTAAADQCNGEPFSIPVGKTILAASAGNTTLGFTDDYQGTCSQALGGPDRVFQFTPQKTGTMTVTIGYNADGTTVTCSAGIDTPGCWDYVLYARNNCPDAAAGAELDCSDVNGPDIETISFPVTINTPYWVIVDGYDDQSYSTGPFSLLVDLQ
jgi:hypothetical protein